MHGDDVAAVTDKAARIVASAVAYPDAPADIMAYADRRDAVVVIGGGVAGTQAAAELAQMGHHVDLVERRPFLGGRAARIGTVFPTNDCGQCLPTTDAQAGTRKCFHRNVAIDHPELSIWRRATVESVSGRPGDFAVSIRRLPNIVTDACVNCGTCETVCPAPASEPGKKAIFTEFYDGRVVRTVDLDTCTFCGSAPRSARWRPSTSRSRRNAPRCTPERSWRPSAASRRRTKFISYLGYAHERVVTQVELTELLDDWEAQASLGRMPVEEVVMVQCAGSRDRRRLPYCSRLCCMIALKHAIRLRTLFPRMKVTICYLEMRTAGVGYENWFLAARRAGVEFLRGTPPEVQFDGEGRPVIEVEDVTAGRKLVLRPDLVVLSTGMVPAAEVERMAQTLGMDLDEDGFIEIMDRKNRATETTAEGIFVCGSAAGPKALIEVQHRGLGGGQRDPQLPHLRRAAAAPPPPWCSRRSAWAATSASPLCPFGAITPGGAAGRRAAARRGEGRRQAGRDRRRGLPCLRHLRRQLPRDGHRPQPRRDDALFGRIELMTQGVERPVVGFYCRECAGAAIALSGQRRDAVPGLGAPHRAALPGARERPAHRRGGPAGRRRRVPGRLRRGPLPVSQRRHQRRRAAAHRRGAAGRGRHAVPLELWHLCAVDRSSVGRRIRLFQARADRRRASARDARGRSWRSSAPAAAPPALAPGGAASGHHWREHLAATVDAALREFERLPRSACCATSAASAPRPAPAAGELDRGPRRLVRLMLAGEIEAVMTNEDLWRCSECGTCTRRLPHGRGHRRPS